MNLGPVKAFGERIGKNFTNDHLIFIHIPKTAGNAVLASLPPPYTLHTHNTRNPSYKFYRKWHDLYLGTAFCVLRHPVARFLSAFNYLLSGGREAEDTEDAHRLGLYQVRDICAFVSQRLGDEDVQSQIHFRPQIEWIRNSRHQLQVDYILDYGQLQKALNEFYRRNGKPQVELAYKNVIHSKTFDRSDLGTLEIDLIEKCYAEDLFWYNRTARETNGLLCV